MANVRKSLSKQTRFEVFKRDGFVCMYCGAHPPSVLLHVDHIKPVADGGKNDIDNLITACEPCNLGKGARPLSAIPQSLEEKSKIAAEREAQILGFQEILESKRERIERELWIVAEEIEPGSPEKGMNRDWTGSIRIFIEKIGFHECFSAAQTARAKKPYGGKKTFLYFCGICWNKVREAA